MSVGKPKVQPLHLYSRSESKMSPPSFGHSPDRKCDLQSNHCAMIFMVPPMKRKQKWPTLPFSQSLVIVAAASCSDNSASSVASASSIRSSASMTSVCATSFRAPSGGFDSQSTLLLSSEQVYWKTSELKAFEAMCDGGRLGKAILDRWGAGIAVSPVMYVTCAVTYLSDTELAIPPPLFVVEGYRNVSLRVGIQGEDLLVDVSPEIIGKKDRSQPGRRCA